MTTKYPMREVGRGLAFPEGPIALDDGSVLVVEIAAGNLTRVDPAGIVTVVAHCGGGPNGAALGPDGAVYVCNDGGLEFVTIDEIHQPIALATDNTGGSIQRVDLDTGDIDTVYTHWGEQPITSTNDIVFDAGGWFYFVDTGSGAIYYAHPDGSAIDRAASGLEFPNGMGLSPDGGRLYASETYSGRLWRWRVAGPGVLAERTLLLSTEGVHGWDGLAVDAEENICAANLQLGGITVVGQDGQVRVEIAVPEIGSVRDQHLLWWPRPTPSIHHVVGTRQAPPGRLAVPRSTPALRPLTAAPLNRCPDPARPAGGRQGDRVGR
jgi:gluconolactonase